MTLTQLQTLQDVIDAALDALPNGSTPELVDWLKDNHPDVIEEHREELMEQGLGARIRNRRKERTPIEEYKCRKNLCLDFGLPELELDTEISVPKNMNNILGDVDWTFLETATLEEIDQHIALLEAKAHFNSKKARVYTMFRQAAAKYANGNLTLTIRQLGEIARRQKKEEQ